MDCPELPVVSAQEFVSGVLGGRKLMRATLEVTQRCNNRCAHCYLDPANRTPAPDPPFEFLIDLLDALRQEQCLFVAITGGEPLLRPDFPELWRHIKRQGFIPSLLTNACLITDDIADLLHDFPPKHVSVTLYGATRETYERVSGAPGSFDAAMAGIRRLHERGVAAELKAMALQDNHHEIAQIGALANRLGWDFRFDPILCPTVDGDTSVQQGRLDPETVVGLDAAHPQRLDELRERHRKLSSQPPVPRAFPCGVGRWDVWVNAEGTVLPCGLCSMLAQPLDRDNLRGSLREIFCERFPELFDSPPVGSPPCLECRLQALCPLCGATRQLETGSPSLPVKYGCRIAQLRARLLGIDDALPAGVAATAESG